MESESKFTIIPTANFKREANILSKKYYSFADDLELVINEILKNPFCGSPLGQNCYKIRFAVHSKGKGKRSGARLISLVKIQNNTIFLISVYDKSAKDSVTDNELKEIMNELKNKL